MHVIVSGSRHAARVMPRCQTLPVAAHMFDLPSVPPFPLYGLDRRFDGYRWLIIWNDRKRLHTVTLGHGPGKAKQFVAVTTVLKMPAQHFSDPENPLVGIGPSGYEGALWAALDGLTDDSRWMTDHANLADWADADPTGPPVSHGPGWVTADVDVDVRCQAAMSFTHDDRIAWLVDLPAVAVSVVGPVQLVHERLSLVDVSEHLGEYA